MLALINDPKVLILDELTTGLDAISRNEIRDYLKKLHTQKGVTIFMVSHYMDEIEELCNKVFVLNEGVISAEGDPVDLAERNNCKNLEQYLRVALAQ